MGAAATEEKLLTIAEYLEMEDASEVRHEFQNGKTIEMAGGILHHNAIKLRFAGRLDQLLESAKLPHMALNSETKVRIESTNRFVYPDVTISDGTPEYYTTPDGNTRRDIIINPLVVIEVLSEDTRGNDYGGKIDSYCSIPTLREFILVDSDTVWSKSMYLQDPENNLWKHETLTDREARLHVRSLGLSLPLDDIYAAQDKLPK